jgi:adenine-specific DNA-methyltransferase
VLDTLYLYDYPESHGIGRCRADRFVTGFSVKSRVRGSFLQLAQGVAALGASLVLSYPTRGLLAAAGYNVEDTLRTSFRTVKVVREEKLSHSTLGGRHGSAEVKAVEQVWVARP